MVFKHKTLQVQYTIATPVGQCVKANLLSFSNMFYLYLEFTFDI